MHLQADSVYRFYRECRTAQARPHRKMLDQIANLEQHFAHADASVATSICARRFASQQAASWAGGTTSSGGAATVQRPPRKAQRGANEQPGGRRVMSGG